MLGDVDIACRLSGVLGTIPLVDEVLHLLEHHIVFCHVLTGVHDVVVVLESHGGVRSANSTDGVVLGLDMCPVLSGHLCLAFYEVPLEADLTGPFVTRQKEPVVWIDAKWVLLWQAIWGFLEALAHVGVSQCLRFRQGEASMGCCVAAISH